MHHATHTGYLAGTPFCGCNKTERLAAGDTFSHVPYSNIEEFWARPDICPACKAEWDAADSACLVVDCRICGRPVVWTSLYGDVHPICTLPEVDNA